MKYDSRYVAVGLLLAITLTAGLLHGSLTGRFGVPEDMNEATVRLNGLTKLLETRTFGERGQWRMAKTATMSPLIIDTLSCQAYLNASFVNSEMPNLQIDGFIVLGPPGPISVHTPEVCYDSRNYEKKEARKRVKIFEGEDRQDELWGLTMRSGDVSADVLRIYYGWTESGPWTAPESPRVSYGGESKLYKIQLAAKLPSDVNISQSDACKMFLQDFLPVVDRQLFSKQATAP